MSDADDDAVTVSSDGITVRKTVDTEQFQTLAVVIELASERDEEARVQVLDAVPDGVPMEDVGFHPDYGAEHWSVEDGTVAFERDLAPGEAYTTIYGIRDYPAAEIDALLSNPEVGLVDTDEEGLDSVIDEERSEAVREFISGEADLPGLEDEITADADTAKAAEAVAEATDVATQAADEPEPASTAEPDTAEEPEPPAQPGEAQPEPASEPSASEPEPGVEPDEAEPEPETAAEEPAEAEPAVEPDEAADREVRVPLTGGVVRVLIKELREGDVDPEDRRLLREELLDMESTTEARVSHLQQRVSDLEAYSDALEAFIDAEGTAEQVIADLRDDMEDIERRVRTVGDRVDDVGERTDSVEDRLESVANDVGTVQARTDQLGDRLENAEEDIGGLDQRADDLAARLDGVATEVDAVDDRVDQVDGEVEALGDELDTLRRDLRSDIQDLEGDLADFEAFRDRLSSVFGGAGGPAGPSSGADEG